MSIRVFVVATSVVLAACSGSSEIDRLESVVHPLLEKGHVPGATVALIEDGRLVGVRAFGVADASTEAPLTEETVFEAASLSKPVFAYGVHKLVERGEIDLDRPLSEYLLYEDVKDDERVHRITARMVLCHTSGFPNWRPRHFTKNPGALTINFDPGARFSYSGEGYVYLQRVVEHLTGQGLEEFAKAEIFEPLGMTSSSYVWQPKYDETSAMPHDFLGETRRKTRPDDANAAASLHTTAGDFGRFVAEILRHGHVMMTPQVEVEDGVSWGLGWGLENGGDTFWHWGDNGSFRCFVMASRETATGLVLFTNSNNGLAIAEPIVEAALGGDHPAFSFIDYDRYDAPGFQTRQRLVRAGLADGADGVAAALPELEDGLSESVINQAGYDLLRSAKLEAAIAVFAWNVERHPDSGNVYDSLAEAYAKKGDTEAAIRHYTKSLELDPANENARAMLAQLRDLD